MLSQDLATFPLGKRVPSAEGSLKYPYYARAMHQCMNRRERPYRDFKGLRADSEPASRITRYGIGGVGMEPDKDHELYFEKRYRSFVFITL